MIRFQKFKDKIGVVSVFRKLFFLYSESSEASGSEMSVSGPRLGIPEIPEVSQVDTGGSRTFRVRSGFLAEVTAFRFGSAGQGFFRVSKFQKYGFLGIWY